MKKYDAKSAWTSVYNPTSTMAFPSEYVIRILKGSYPHLNLNKSEFSGAKFCDLGCGDGRNLLLANKCGFEIYGMEITDEIVQKVSQNLKDNGVQKSHLAIGTSDSLPFEDGLFDYLLSWNACYYMGQKLDFSKHVSEMGRIMKKDAWLILSIPQKSCFIYSDSQAVKGGFRRIQNDWFGARNGEILKVFKDKEEVEKEFSNLFYDFSYASIFDNCFGLNYHWHLYVCRRK